MLIVHTRLHRSTDESYGNIGHSTGYDWITYMEGKDRIGDLRGRIEKRLKRCKTFSTTSKNAGELPNDLELIQLKRKESCWTEIVDVVVDGWVPGFEDCLSYAPETVDAVKRNVAASSRENAFEFQDDLHKYHHQLNIPDGITHLSLVRVAGRVFLRKEYTEREAWKCEAYCKLQATAAINHEDDHEHVLYSVTPLAFGLSHEDVSDVKYSGIYTELVPDTQDVYSIMLSASLGKTDRDTFESQLNSRSLVHLATLDVLTGNYRHGGNILIHRTTGRVIGIDHDFAFSGSSEGTSDVDMWGRIDGPIVGRTMALRWSFRMQDILDRRDIARSLDYEKHVGALGTNFPVGTMRTMKMLRDASDEKIIKLYGIRKDAILPLRKRLESMLKLGMENTIDRIIKFRDERNQIRVLKGQWLPATASYIKYRIETIFKNVPNWMFEDYKYEDDCVCTYAYILFFSFFRNLCCHDTRIHLHPPTQVLEQDMEIRNTFFNLFMYALTVESK